MTTLMLVPLISSLQVRGFNGSSVHLRDDGSMFSGILSEGWVDTIQDTIEDNLSMTSE